MSISTTTTTTTVTVSTEATSMVSPKVQAMRQEALIDAYAASEYAKAEQEKEAKKAKSKAKYNSTKKLRRTVKGRLEMIYHNQVSHSKARGNFPPAYSMQEFVANNINDATYLRIFREWAYGGYMREDAPSNDRIDDYKGYSLENNNGWVTWGQNKTRGSEDRKSGKNNKISVAILVRNPETGTITRYYSQSQCSRELGFNTGCISRACKKKLTYKGLEWRFEDNKLYKD